MLLKIKDIDQNSAKLRRCKEVMFNMEY